LGFDHPDQRYIVGIDFPNNTMPSFYSKEETFGVVVKEYVRMLTLQKYKLIVIVNGHGATNQIYTLDRIAKEISAETTSRVYVSMGYDDITETESQEFGHACLLETSVQIYLNQENVELSLLPPMDIKLKSREWGIVDTATFQFNPNADKTVIHDPRNATAEKGKILFDKAVNNFVREIEAIWGNIISESC
jgi:creatinine amidohydrolase